MLHANMKKIRMYTCTYMYMNIFQFFHKCWPNFNTILPWTKITIIVINSNIKVVIVVILLNFNDFNLTHIQSSLYIEFYVKNKVNIYVKVTTITKQTLVENRFFPFVFRFFFVIHHNVISNRTSKEYITPAPSFTIQIQLKSNENSSKKENV